MRRYHSIGTKPSDWPYSRSLIFELNDDVMGGTCLATACMHLTRTVAVHQDPGDGSRR